MLLALIISETYDRFKRATGALNGSKFNEVVHMPAIFIPKHAHCKGTEGHRMAIRNAWKIARFVPFTCIFEDDIAPISPLENLHKYIKSQLPLNDILFLGNYKTVFHWNKTDYLTNHAQCISRQGADKLLKLTSNCLVRSGVSVDVFIDKQCKNGKLNCLMQNEYFTQDRKNIKSYIHSIDNKLIDNKLQNHRP